MMTYLPRFSVSAREANQQLAEVKSAYERECTWRKNAENAVAELGKEKRNLNEILENTERQCRKHTYEYKVATATLKDEHEQELKKLKASWEVEKNRLLSQLITSYGQSAAWPDDVLKHNFAKMRVRVKSITSTSRKEFVLSKGYEVGNDLVPDWFITKHRIGKAHFWFKKVIWDILEEELFNHPFGFSALGGRRVLDELNLAYSNWNKLFHPDDTVSKNFPNFEVFRNDDAANTWRTTTFHAIDKASNQEDGDSSSPLFKSRAEHLRKTGEKIVEYLSRVADKTHHKVPTEVETEVHELVKIAGDIAIQFGINQDELQLIHPSQPVEGDPAPGLRKFGRSREGKEFNRVLVQCAAHE